MNNRIQYSTIRCKVWNGYKERVKPKRRNVLTFFEFLASMTKRQLGLRDGHDSDIDVFISLSALMGVFACKLLRVTHFFLNPGVGEFCCESVKHLSSDYHKRLPVVDPIGDQVDLCRKSDLAINNPYFLEMIDDIAKLRVFALHFPSSYRRDSLVVIDLEDLAQSGHSNKFDNGWHGICFDGKHITALSDVGCSDGEKEYHENYLDALSAIGCEDNLWSYTRNALKIVFGFTLYADAFPETIVERNQDNGGVFVKVGNIPSGSKISHVKEHGAVSEEMRGLKTPHWRRGHWRFLRDSRFKKKRGQTVWVNGSFIKGRAFDVLDDAPPVRSAP